MESTFPPGPPATLREKWAGLRRYRRDPLGTLLSLARKYGSITTWSLGPRRIYLLDDAELIRHVLVEGRHAYDKQTVGYRLLRRALGQGLVTSEGELWRRQRRIAQPAFHRNRIEGFADAMLDETESMLARWSGQTEVDLAAEMSRLTLSVVSRTILDTRMDDADFTDVADSVTVVLEYTTDRLTRIVDWPRAIPTPANLRFRRAVRLLDGLVYEKIQQRRSGHDDPGDLLSMLMHARDPETGEGMTDLQLRDEVVTMFGAGHETTANALTWTFYLLDQNPQWRERLTEEVDAATQGETPQLADLARMPLVERVVKESMRLRPPVWVIGRRARQADEVGGYRIEPGAFVLVSPWVTHRNPRYWDDPETFDPDRFLPEPSKSRPRYAYFPFSGGPRQCIGKSFAMLEAQLVLARTVQQYVLSVLPDPPVVLEPLITLRPLHGLKVRLEPRTAAAPLPRTGTTT